MNLTKDEFNILKALKTGLSYTEIEEKLGIRLYTNDPRVMSLYDKYNVTNRLDLCKRANLSEVKIIN